MDNSQTLDNEINRFGRDLQQQGIDVTGYSKNDLLYIWNISKLCAKEVGRPLGARGAVAGAAVSIISGGTITIPSVLAGFLAGFVGGTVSCVIARGSMKPMLDQLLKNQ